MSYNDTYDVESYGNGYAPMLDHVNEHYRDNDRDAIPFSYAFQSTPYVTSAPTHYSMDAATIPRSAVSRTSELLIQIMKYNDEYNDNRTSLDFTILCHKFCVISGIRFR